MRAVALTVAVGLVAGCATETSATIDGGGLAVGQVAAVDAPVARGRQRPELRCGPP
jgi:hypothetical protein